MALNERQLPSVDIKKKRLEKLYRYEKGKFCKKKEIAFANFTEELNLHKTGSN